MAREPRGQVKETRGQAEVLAGEVRQSVGDLVRRLRAETTERELSWSQTTILKRIARTGPTTTAELARAERVTPQSMGATLAQLVEAGLVARTPDATDRRRWNVALTASGRRTLASGRAVRQAWLAGAIAGKLDAREQRTLLEATALLRRLVSP